MDILTDLFFRLLVILNSATGNLGLAIILFTILIRSIVLPLSLPSIKAQKRIQELQPEIKQLKAKHGKDKKAYQVAQMELYKKYNVNPLAGCLPQLLQIGVLFFLYQALNNFLNQPVIEGVTINPQFLWLNLTSPDALYIIPVLAALTQLVLSLMIIPATETPDVVPNNSKKKKVVEANKKEEDVAEMAASMQQQMMYIMPLMTGFIALSFPAGLGLYWIASTLFSIAQQYFLSGPGGIVTYTKRIASRFGLVKTAVAQK
ncbi:MAG: YidC/Oxa1 family membrane protein insertase [bacterium]|nr:YidC/Oxa1 family membrane protein insertase [bacterium]